VDTICDVAKQGMLRGRPWHALQAQSFTMTQVSIVVSFGGKEAEGMTLKGTRKRDRSWRSWVEGERV
jgi:hypothetical protein